MPADSNLVLQASVTKVDSFNSVGLNLPTGTPSRGLVARVIYSAASEASGSKTVTFKVQHGDTLGGTYYDLSSAADQVITLTTTDQAGEISIPFRTKRAYVRLVVTLSANTNSPTITYQGHVVLARP